jgi:D-ribose pyranose/furanose isomerase RbsD
MNRSSVFFGFVLTGSIATILSSCSASTQSDNIALIDSGIDIKKITGTIDTQVRNTARVSLKEAMNDVLANLNIENMGFSSETIKLLRTKKLLIRYDIAKSTVNKDSVQKNLKGISQDALVSQFGDWYVGFVGIQDIGYIAEVWYPIEKPSSLNYVPSFFARRLQKALPIQGFDEKIKNAGASEPIWIYSRQGSQFFLKNSTQEKLKTLTSFTKNEKINLICSPKPDNTEVLNLFPVLVDNEECYVK